ncbi:MAG: T9SS type A sorting domain-containing protein [Bacteroidetes bacterium]|nr:T9SS type A sorting domain-containing protein [Bacteroidota bacterium]
MSTTSSSSNTATPGTTVTAATYPSLSGETLKSVGENLGSGTGQDGQVDGKLRVTLGSMPVANANLGLELAPTTSNYTFGNQPNPEGYNYYTIPVSGFTGTDADGSVQSLVISSFPANANYLKVGSVIYTNGGTCPPQSTCTSWPGTVTTAYSTVGSIAVDPSASGNTTVTLSYSVIDNGNLGSNAGSTSTITIPFIAPASPITVSGEVWNDDNGNGTQDAGESNSNAASSGQTLYAMLVQKTNTYSGSNTILSSVGVASGTGLYSFSSVPNGNSYEIRIASLASKPADGSAWSSITPALASGYTGVSTYDGSTISANQNTVNLVNDLGTVTGDKSNINFGIEQIPVADAKTFTTPNNAFTKDASITISGNPSYSILASSTSLNGSNPRSLSGTDAEDCSSTSSCTTGKKFKINSIKSNTLLYYFDGSTWQPVSANQAISNFTLSNLRIHGEQGQGNTSGTSLGFSYSLVDAAGVASSSVNYSIQSVSPLPISLLSFEAETQHCKASISWSVAYELQALGYELQQSQDGASYSSLAFVAATNKEGKHNYSLSVSLPEPVTFIRLKLMNQDGSFDFSNTLRVESNCSVPGNVQVYPNPANNSIRLDGITSGSIARVNSMAGKTILEWYHVANGQTCSIESLAPGCYLLEVIAPDASTSRIRLMKQ